MKMRHLRYFVAVAEELSFTRAAERLRTAQPSLSQQIRQLEDRVGVQLLERNQRSVKLTPAGEVLLSEAKAILRHAQRAVERTRAAVADKASSVRLGVIPAAEMGILPRLMNEMRSRLPSTEIVIKSRTPQRLLADLASGEIDALFSRLKEQEEHQLRRDGFEVMTAERHRLVVVMAASDRLAEEESVDSRALADRALIAVDPGEAPELHRFINAVLDRLGVTLTVAQTAENVLSSVSRVEMGLGVAILPDYIRSMQRPNIVYRPLADAPDQLALHFVVRPGAEPALSTLREVVRHLAPDGPALD